VALIGAWEKEEIWNLESGVSEGARNLGGFATKNTKRRLAAAVCRERL